MCPKFRRGKKRFKDMFKGFKNNFFKLKTEARGWSPCECEVNYENQLCRHELQYLLEYEQREDLNWTHLN